MNMYIHVHPCINQYKHVHNMTNNKIIFCPKVDFNVLFQIVAWQTVYNASMTVLVRNAKLVSKLENEEIVKVIGHYNLKHRYFDHEIDGFVQDCSNSSLLQSCAKPSKY